MATLKTRMAAQTARRAELDALRLSRALTPAEQHEADNLAQRLYMREWRRSFGMIATRSPGHAA